MECTKCREIVSAALDDQALHQELEHADQHMAGCASCSSLRDDLTADRLLLQQWPDELPGERVVRQGAGIRRLAAAAVLVLAIGAGFFAGRISSTVEIPSPSPERIESNDSPSMFRQESTKYFPDSNEMYSTAVLRIDRHMQE